MKLNLPSRKFILGMLSALIAVAILVTGVPAAYAEGTAPLSPIPGLGRLPNETLVHMHKKEGTWFTDQESLLTQASQLSGTFQTLIDAETKRNRNVSGLQDALATFNSELAACREIHALAGATIYSLVGWRADGGVKDRMAAGQSLLDGRASLKDANFRMTDAMFQLRKSFTLWRASHIHVVSGPTLTPTP